MLTAEFSKPTEISEAAFHDVMFELGLLTVLILALVFSLSADAPTHRPR